MNFTRKQNLPRWLSLTIVALLAMHLGVILVFSFSLYLLPNRFRTWTDIYVTPWFYANFIAFAPEPPLAVARLEYRVFTNGEWTQFKSIAPEILRKQHAFRLSHHTKELDLLESVANNIMTTSEHIKASSNDTSVAWMRFPAFKAAERCLKHYEPKWSVTDMWQIRISVTEHMVQKNRLVLNHRYDVFPVFTKQ